MRKRPSPVDGVLFDLDGVVTDTAIVHRLAWSQLFRSYFDNLKATVSVYTETDYFAYLDGKARADGVRSLLASRGITLPEGYDSEPPGEETVNGLANTKNTLFEAMLEREGVQEFPGTLRFLNVLAGSSTAVAIVSSSRNARSVLAAAGLLDRFEVVVDGNVAIEAGLPGKPAPDMFTYAARQLDVNPARSVVLEDAESGVTAASRAGFWVVGVDRGAGADALCAAGANEIVSDVGDLISGWT